jgi:hypothetical protein
MDVLKRAQRDLFAPEVASAALQPAIRAKLEPLLRSLLTEVTCRQPHAALIASPNEREGGDDQDHA